MSCQVIYYGTKSLGTRLRCPYRALVRILLFRCSVFWHPSLSRFHHTFTCNLVKGRLKKCEEKVHVAALSCVNYYVTFSNTSLAWTCTGSLVGSLNTTFSLLADSPSFHGYQMDNVFLWGRTDVHTGLITQYAACGDLQTSLGFLFFGRSHKVS